MTHFWGMELFCLDDSFFFFFLHLKRKIGHLFCRVCNSIQSIWIIYFVDIIESGLVFLSSFGLRLPSLFLILQQWRASGFVCILEVPHILNDPLSQKGLLQTSNVIGPPWREFEVAGSFLASRNLIADVSLAKVSFRTVACQPYWLSEPNGPRVLSAAPFVARVARKRTVGLIRSPTLLLPHYHQIALTWQKLIRAANVWALKICPTVKPLWPTSWNLAQRN